MSHPLPRSHVRPFRRVRGFMPLVFTVIVALLLAACGAPATTAPADGASTAPAADASVAPAEAASAAAETSSAATTSGDTIKLGILHSLSGTMSISEVSVRDADAAGDRGDQRRRRRARQADRAGRRGRRQRLADLRREGQEADPAGQGGCGLRLLDQRQPQGRAAGVRGPERAAVLPGAVRGPGGIAQHLLHRRRPPTSRSSRPSST